MQIKASLIFKNIPIEIKQKRKWFVASCHLFDVHSQGENEDKAVTNIKTAVRLFLQGCLEMGTLHQVLKEHLYHSLDRIFVPDRDGIQDYQSWLQSRRDPYHIRRQVPRLDEDDLPYNRRSSVFAMVFEVGEVDDLSSLNADL
jgi:predicted RNase H-like HicB family nuclease